MNNESLFGQAYEQIYSTILGQYYGQFNYNTSFRDSDQPIEGAMPDREVRYLQLISNPGDHRWPDVPSGQIARDAYQFMSATPAHAAIDVFGSPDRPTFFDSYRQVLAHVMFNLDDEKIRKLSNLSTEVANSRNQLAQTWANAKRDYDNLIQREGKAFLSDYPSLEAWINGPAGKPGARYRDEAETWQNKNASLIDQVLQLNNEYMPAELQDAMYPMERPYSDPNTSDVPQGWSRTKTSQGSLEFVPDFRIAAESGDWRNRLSNGTIGEKTINFTASASNDVIAKCWAYSSSVSLPFWSLFSGGNWEEANITERDKSVTATVTMESAMRVAIEPGSWYDSGILEALAAPYFDGSSATGSGFAFGSRYEIVLPYAYLGGDNALLGRDGLCPRMVNGLVVVYKPRFSITMDRNNYFDFGRKFDASTGLRIGPFAFGGSAGDLEMFTEWNGDRITVTGNCPSSVPSIIGVTVGFPGFGKPV